MRRAGLALAVFLLATVLPLQAAQPVAPNVTRLGDGPIIVPDMDSRMGSNIQGPSLIRVPEWVENRLGDYYLYFADHRGTYIRLAYADALQGPWQMHETGSLKLEDSHFPTTCPPCSLASGTSAALYAHIASPDVHVDDENQQIVMYLHGRDAGRQLTRLAISRDGINFEGSPEVLGRPYFRVIKQGQYHYALSMPGYLYRSEDGLSEFQEGPRFFNDNMRHNALLIRDNTLHVFWAQVGDAPERIYMSTIDMQGDWMQWQESEPVEVLRPETEFEGALLEIASSRRGHIDERVNQLRDPTIFAENGRVYLLYAVAGEHGIAIAELDFD
ncbi:MAG: hypothetical protein WDZ52_12040 [Pseudohongiellaceae bacterium]